MPTYDDTCYLKQYVEFACYVGFFDDDNCVIDFDVYIHSQYKNVLILISQRGVMYIIFQPLGLEIKKI